MSPACSLNPFAGYRQPSLVPTSALALGTGRPM
ncbi:hypothetical protein BN439_0049 [Erwinia amylovora Ea644]|nr:hypothetical protein BN439_0049 [Erwinia amylovora Ea644]CCP05130.1 hypothetical protein BN440_0064 [Erwinia amylovora MR1]